MPTTSIKNDLDLVESSTPISSEVLMSSEATMSSKASTASQPSGSSESTTTFKTTISSGATTSSDASKPTTSKAMTSSDFTTTSEVPTSSSTLAPHVGCPPDNEGTREVVPMNDKKTGSAGKKGDHMAPPKATPKELSGGKKRKNEGSAPVPKRTKTTRKEDEKENRSKTQSPNASPSVPGCSRVSPVNTEPSRRKSKPVKLCDRQKQLTVHTHTEGAKLLAHYSQNMNLAIANCRFRSGNVVLNKAVREGKARIQQREIPGFEVFLENVISENNERNDHHELCMVNFTKICSWGNNNADAQNFATDAASVLSYTLIVDHQDQVKIIENGLSSVSFKHIRISDSAKGAPNWKNVTVTSDELNSAKYIYYAVVVRRMAPFTEKRASRAPTVSSSALLDPATLKREAGIGCIKMYEKGKPNKMNNGVQRIILVREDESPAIGMLSAEKESESFIGWMKNTANLVTLHKLNANNLDSHIFRVVFESYCEDFQPTVEPTSAPPPRPRVQNAGFFDRSLGIAIPQRKQDYFRARFPFLIVNQLPEELDLQFKEGYFNDHGKITHIGDWSFYRPRCDRTIAISKRAAIEAGEDVDDSDDSFTRNRAPGNRKLYGLEFVQQPGHCPFRKDIHRRRKARLLPPLNPDAVLSDDDDEMMDDDDGERNDETFPLNNPAMMTAFELRFKKKQVVPPECRIPGSEMSVVRVPVTEKQKQLHNARLMAAKADGIKPLARRENPEYDKNDPNADLDGRPIPTFCQIFFPEVKSDIYDMLLRNYLSEVGCRPGSFSADWKSRIMTGFAIAHHEVIFEQKLECIFEKHLQMVGSHSADWKICHYQVPRKKFYELKREWLAKQQSAQN